VTPNPAVKTTALVRICGADISGWVPHQTVTGRGAMVVLRDGTMLVLDPAALKLLVKVEEVVR
jgi:hypothetical protein